LLENITNIPNISMGHRVLFLGTFSLDTRHVTKWAPSYCNKEPTRCQSCWVLLWVTWGLSGFCVSKNSEQREQQVSVVSSGFLFLGLGACFFWFVFCKLVFTGSGRGCGVGHPKGRIVPWGTTMLDHPHFLQSLRGHCIGVPRGMYPPIYPQKPNIPVIASRDFLTFG